jgi:hypothetical protein
MSATYRLLIVAACLAGAAGLADAQVELDRIVARVGARIITQSDVRQARLLQLVDDVSSDAAARRCLEDRWLILEEMKRGAPLPPGSDADLTRHRAEWERKVGGASAVPDLLAKAAMSEAALQAWLRDDLRIQAYVTRQFAELPEADRSRASTEWIGRLRQRARIK